MELKQVRLCYYKTKTDENIRYTIHEGRIVIFANVYKSTHELSHGTKAFIDDVLFGRVVGMKPPVFSIVCDYPELVQRNYPCYEFVGRWTTKTKVDIHTPFIFKSPLSFVSVSEAH